MVSAFAGDPASARRASTLRAKLLASAERELNSYAPVLDVLRLPASDPSRAEKLDEALSQASQAPYAIVRAATEVAELAALRVNESKPALKGDAAAGVLLAEAASQAAARLVEINLAGRSGDPRLTEIAALLRRSANARNSVLGP